MGSKSSSQPAPPPVAPPADTTSSIEPFMQMMAMMSQQTAAAMSQASAPPELPPMPSVNQNKVSTVDWTEALDKLSRKAAADYKEEQKKSHGRKDTVHTSPLLDDEEADTTDSILAGK